MSVTAIGMDNDFLGMAGADIKAPARGRINETVDATQQEVVIIDESKTQTRSMKDQESDEERKTRIERSTQTAVSMMHAVSETIENIIAGLTFSDEYKELYLKEARSIGHEYYISHLGTNSNSPQRFAPMGGSANIYADWTDRTVRRAKNHARAYPGTKVTSESAKEFEGDGKTIKALCSKQYKRTLDELETILDNLRLNPKSD